MVDNYYKTNIMLEKTLLEEINRFKSINKNAKSLYVINEQEAPLPPALPGSEEELPSPEPDPAAGMDTEMGPGPVMDSSVESTEEVDVTDLVNMTKNIKNELEQSKTENGDAIRKMDDVFSKLDDLEQKLSGMDSILSMIDQLGAKVDGMKPVTPQEKLEMRSLDSYPFNEKPQEFFAHKQDEMRASGKNEYILTKNDIQNYSKETVAKTFNPYDNDEQESRFQY
jgi:hypothetical protein